MMMALVAPYPKGIVHTLLGAGEQVAGSFTERTEITRGWRQEDACKFHQRNDNVCYCVVWTLSTIARPHAQ
jgi:hypothetical protein